MIATLKRSPHWIDFFQKKKDLRKAKEGYTVPIDVIEIMEDDLRKMQN